MKIVVCDDEPVFVEQIADYCKKFETDYQIPIDLVKYTSGTGVLTYYEENKDVDIFILDIIMKRKTGLQVADELHKRGARGKIIFLTSMTQYAIEGYEYGACRYWLKPLEYKKFASTIQEIYMDIKESGTDYLIEYIGTSIEKVYLDEILYIGTERRKTRVQKSNGFYLSNVRMAEYEKKLDGRFSRCHAAYIVNMSHISKVDGLEICMNNGEKVFISKGKRKQFLDAFCRYLNERNIKTFNMI